MADVITRLKLESGEFDSKIKRAVSGLQNMEQECRKVGGTLAVLEKDQLEFVKGLGQMETVSKSARGRLGELTQAYTELAMQYKRLTDEEKKGDFGKALSASLEQLKTRIGETKAQLGDVTKELNGGGGLKDALDAVAGKFGLSIDQVTKFGGVVAVTTTAVKVVKDAFFQSEGNIDEWGRTVEGAKGAYDVFLQTINNGNWSNFFQNLSTAIQGARDLYDALDRLGSIKGNNQAAIAIVQQQIAQLRLMKQQGKDVDDQLKAATANLAALQKQAVTAGKNAGAATMQQTIRNGVNSMGGAAVSDRNIEAAIGGILYKGQAEFDKYRETVNKFENYSGAQRTKVRTISDSQGNTYNQTYKEFDLTLLTKEQQRQYKLAKAITERETEIQKGIAIYAQAVQEGTANAREEFKGNRYALQGSGGGKGSSGGKTTTAATEKEVTIQQQIAKLEQEAYTASDERRAEIAKQVQELDKELEKQKAIRDEVHGIVKEQTEQKRLADAMVSGAQAMINNDLKGWYSANQKVIAAGGQAQEIPVKFSLTEDNLDAFKKHLKEQLNDAEIGSDLFKALTSQLNDATMLGDFLSIAMKNGLDTADITPIWEQIFKGEPGDYISDETWQKIKEKLEGLMKDNGISLNFNTGEAKETKKDSGMEQLQKTMSTLNQGISGLSSINSGLAAMGINLGSGIGQAISAMQGVMQVINGVTSVIQMVNSLTSSTEIPAQANNTFALYQNTGALWALEMALQMNSATSMIPFMANGGVVGRAASGLLVGTHMSGDNLRMPVVGGGMIGINDGELILNKAQQGVIADALNNNGGEIGGGTPYVTGEMIFLGMNNYTKANGYGEVVTSRR